MKRLILLINILFHCTVVSAQTSSIDSLEQRLQDEMLTVSQKTQTLTLLCEQYRNSNELLLKKYADQLLAIGKNDSTSEAFGWGHYFTGDYHYMANADELVQHHMQLALIAFEADNNTKGIAESSFSLANLHFNKDRYRAAITFAEKSLEAFYKTGNKENQANTLALICDIYTYMDRYNQAIQYCIQSLKLKEELAIKKGKEITLNTIGRIYEQLGTEDKAHQYYQQALQVAKKNGEPYNIATTNSNMGNFFLNHNNPDSALFYFHKALEIDSVSADSVGLAYSYFDLGQAYLHMGNLTKAETLLHKSEKLSEREDLPELIANVGISLGELYSKQDQYQDAIATLKNSLTVAQKINSVSVLKDCYQKLFKTYDLIGDKENALVYMRLYLMHTEKLNQAKNAEQIAETEAIYNIEKKQKEIDLLKQQNEISALKSRQRTILAVALGAVLLFVFILVMVLFNRNNIKNKANKQLMAQNDAIEKQKEEIEQQKDEISTKNKILEEKNQQITDSITYARQIQESLLPDLPSLKRVFPKSFIYYKPKDIVSGDFYWYSEIEGKIAIAVVDCTGHGVPGAFMTVLANSILNQIILESGITSPNLVVSLLDQKIKQNLHQTQHNSVSMDGLDIGLCFIDKKDLSLEFTGAKIPLYYADGGKELKTIEADRFSAGSTQELDKVFTKKSLQLKEGDIIYLSTDGFQDQFGGSKNKKFMKGNFKTLLAQLKDLPVTEQDTELQQTFQRWRGITAQTDDILILGIRV